MLKALLALIRDDAYRTPQELAAALAVALVAIGFVEYQTRTLLLNPKVISSNQFSEYFRVNSLFFDPNIYGRFLAVVILGVIAAVLCTASVRNAVIGAVLLVYLWAGLVHTLSQSSFTALLAGLSACNDSGSGAPPQGAAPPPAPVGIVAVKAEPVPIVSELPGRIAPTRIAQAVSYTHLTLPTIYSV